MEALSGFYYGFYEICTAMFSIHPPSHARKAYQSVMSLQKYLGNAVNIFRTHAGFAKLKFPQNSIENALPQFQCMHPEKQLIELGNSKSRNLDKTAKFDVNYIRKC